MEKVAITPSYPKNNELAHNTYQLAKKERTEELIAQSKGSVAESAL